MDVLTILKILWQRWWIFVPVVAITIGLVIYLNSVIPREFEANGTVLLSEVSASGEQADGTDGDGALEGPLDISSLLLAERAQSDAVREELRTDGATASYRVRPEAGGILRVIAEDEDAEVAVDTVVQVLDRIRRDAEAEGAVEGTNLQVLNVPTSARAVASTDPVSGEVTEVQRAEGSLYFDPGGGVENPFQANTYTAKILEQVVNAEGTRSRLLTDDGASEYQVSMNRTDPAPLMYVEVTGNEPVEMLQVYDAVVGALETELARRQEAAGVDPSEQTVIERLSTPQQVEAQSGARLRPLAAVLGVGLFLAVLLAVLLDGVLVRRARATTLAMDPVNDDDAGGERADAERMRVSHEREQLRG